MSGIDFHPEDLIDRVRRGQATAAERERVRLHLQSCEACRFEDALLAEGTRDAAPRSGDAERARRIERAATAALAARGLLAPQAAPARRRRAGALIAAAAVSSLATAAAAAVLTQPQWLVEMVQTGRSETEPEPAAPVVARSRTPVVPAKPDVAPELATPQPVVDAELPETARELRRGAPRSAADLFAAANAARRERQTAAAVRLYRELARSHPRSAEASMSRVALGRLLLDRAGDARGALREFDAYLAEPGRRALHEDALIGRALALGRLGREREELAAWSALLDAFPGSAYAERARARQAELR